MKGIKHIRLILKRAGIKVIYTALLLYYAFRRPDLPGWAKTIIIGALGYLLSPFDAIPDLTPLIGYTDDLGLLSYALVMTAAYINEEVRNKAQNKLKHWFPSYTDEAISSVEKIL